MTHDLLQSDIELATSLRDEQRPDEEIIRALVHRGVEPGKAAHLVEDLHTGKKLTVQASLPPEFTLGHRSRSRSAGRGHEQRSHKRSPESASRREPSAQPAARARKKPAVIWLVAAAVVGLILVGIGIALFLRRPAESNSQPQPAPKAAPAKAGRTVRKAMARVPATAQTGALAPLALELRPDGLHLGGSHLTRGNLLAAVAIRWALQPGRTRSRRPGRVIYAYDHHGLLIYSQPGGATNSIVLIAKPSAASTAPPPPLPAR